MSQNEKDHTPPVSLEERPELLVEARRQKREAWIKNGTDVYPTAESCRPKHLAQDLHRTYDHLTKEQLAEEVVQRKDFRFSIAGRVMLHRSFGKATFMTLADRSGRLQIFCQNSKLPAATYEIIKHMDLGDIVYAEGPLFKTKTGELSIDVDQFKLLTKSIRPLPAKFHGFSDIELRYRHRYLDLIANPEVKTAFQIRSQLVSGIRRFFDERDYLEVETPMLHSLVGGAIARPFKTYHNTLKMPLFLRIAPELYLKRLIVGGFERVYEINRCFRNEGISVQHNPEFTMLEFYEAYATYDDLMTMTEELFERLANDILKTTEVPYQEHVISFRRPFRRLSVVEAITEVGHLKPTDEEAMKRDLKEKGITFKTQVPRAELQWRYFEEFIESQLIQPTYITDHPVEVSPLARRSEKNPELVQRFELYIGGREVANGFNELNDPDDQKSRFLDQLRRKAEGDEEASDFDEDYIEALEVGLPPTAGEGIGIDRLAMIFTNSSSIRDVILFPQLRPTQTHEETDES